MSCLGYVSELLVVFGIGIMETELYPFCERVRLKINFHSCKRHQNYYSSCMSIYEFQYCHCESLRLFWWLFTNTQKKTELHYINYVNSPHKILFVGETNAQAHFFYRGMGQLLMLTGDIGASSVTVALMSVCAVIY